MFTTNFTALSSVEDIIALILIRLYSSCVDCDHVNRITYSN